MCEIRLKGFSNLSKLSDVANEHKIQCKCGTKTTFYPFEGKDKKICRGCHHYVFASLKAEFQYRLKEKIKMQEKKICTMKI